ncbi:MAG: replication-associated recombination protein A [Candidatus Theseobacter exili]|nr:replication-associated recombination protein A [Candidatus Theseobacter exili]
MDLFQREEVLENNLDSGAPLAERIRPRSLDNFVGQRHVLGDNMLLRRVIQADLVTSLLFYGPPGSGKTTLASIIASTTKRRFVNLSAVTSNVSEIRKTVEIAKHNLLSGQKTIVFVDEIHRFNKAQQDVLLPFIEKGTISFIGATTHNPFFSVNAPLISRSQIFRLEPLKEDALDIILRRSISDTENGLGNMQLKVEEDALKYLIVASDGDARKAVNALEVAALSTDPDKRGDRLIALKTAKESFQEKALVYDKNENGHYDTISAFIKSMRGSDPDAALYWLAKMLKAGEDIRFIARRILIFASEDIGNADPQALILATAALQAVEFIGMPEARIPLAHAAVYAACAPKSNAAYQGIEKAFAAIEGELTQLVPSHLKNAKDPEEKSEGYMYPHDYKGGIVKQEYLDDKMKFYFPTDRGKEREIKERLEKWNKALQNQL